ncbi:MAG: MFS transporter [Propionibacteriaceae bacterium]|jgi:MFS family permease|nr:MFS transporter [Propionibacteriaceae bacterium]
MNSTFISLTVPNYRRYFIGCLSGNIGNWMSVTAKSWLVLVELTGGSAITLGWLTTVMFLPQFVLQPIGGVMADRFPKRNIAIVTQCLLCLSATTLSLLVLTGHIQLWIVFALALFDGTVGAFDGPARQSFVSELVPASLLPNAIGLNSSSWNAARMFGPAIAGVLIAAFGTGHAFAINAASFLLLIFMLTRMKPKLFYNAKAPDGPPAPKKRSGLLDGLRYVLARPQLTLLFFIAFMLGTFGFNYSITNTLMATAVFHRGAGEYGLLGSIMGIGSLTGALWSARRDLPRIRFVFVFLAGFSVSLILSALSPNFIFFALTMIPIGLCSVSVMVGANSMIQISIPQDVRGRVMALWGIASMGLTPVVSPALGWVGDYLGARATVWVGAIAITVTFVAVAWYLFGKRQLRVHHTRGFHFGVEYPGLGYPGPEPTP